MGILHVFLARGLLLTPRDFSLLAILDPSSNSCNGCTAIAKVLTPSPTSKNIKPMNVSSLIFYGKEWSWKLILDSVVLRNSSVFNMDQSQAILLKNASQEVRLTKIKL